MTSREQQSFDRLVEKAGERFATALPKLRPGMDENEYRLKARDACRRAMGELDKAIKKFDEEKKKRKAEVDKSSVDGHDEKGE